jgi:hypothetical protein
MRRVGGRQHLLATQEQRRRLAEGDRGRGHQAEGRVMMYVVDALLLLRIWATLGEQNDANNVERFPMAGWRKPHGRVYLGTGGFVSSRKR